MEAAAEKKHFIHGVDVEALCGTIDAIKRKQLICTLKLMRIFRNRRYKNSLRPVRRTRPCLTRSRTQHPSSLNWINDK